jgi:hypothetical protein
MVRIKAKLSSKRVNRSILAAAAAVVLVVSKTAWAVDLQSPDDGPFILKAESFRHYVESFNADDDELYPAYIPDGAAWNFLKNNIPLFECPDKDIEEIYYFRWWTYRKHIKLTPDGFIITEFLPDVPWAGKDNSIDAPAGHHIYEGRWLADSKYLDDYSVFWFREGGSPRSYSSWLADALWARYLVNGNDDDIKELLPDLVKNYEAWEKSNLKTNGLFWQIDDRDGMEMSISGNGYRPTINSYMYGDAVAIAKIATLAGRMDVANQFQAKAAELKQLVEGKLWNPNAQFFEVLKQNGTLADVCELLGYTPWYFNLPEDDAIAWKQLMDPKGFYAAFGPTTAEQRNPHFTIAYNGHECQWNGPSWPYATSMTLTAMANLLDNYRQSVVNRQDYFELFEIYTKSQHLELPSGKVVPWIDEDLDPYTGTWISRKLLKEQGSEIPERGKDYNHSTYCDLIITGLVGLRPRADNIVEVDPLIPDGLWDYFCLDDVHYHGHILTIFYDKTGTQYGQGKGLQVLEDGQKIASSRTLRRVTGQLKAASLGSNEQ